MVLWWWGMVGIGVTWLTWTTGVSTPYSFAECLGMLFLDIFLYGFLCWCGPSLNADPHLPPSDKRY
jgi:hypothetical protein